MGEFSVYTNTYAGKCYWTVRRGRVKSVFSYADSYISDDKGQNIDPAFSLTAGAQPSVPDLPGAFRDAAPDRWGRNLIEHRFRRDVRNGRETLRVLNEIDYLMGVSDYSRQGNLRFSLERGGAFMHPASDVPKLVALPKLLYAAERFSAEEDESSISYLLDAGSASLGGARPKASVTDNGKLLMAKFPHRQDEWDVMGWEWVMLEMAGEFHIRVPAHKLVPIDGRNVLITERFDRDGDTRIGYISAMTLLGLEDGERADYADIALGLRDVSVSPKDDLEELFRRIVFSIFVNNTDDHLRNHGFIRSGSGWRLSPLFDVNPNPVTSEQRVTSLFGETQRALALDALRAFPGEFGLKPEQAETIIREAAEITNAYTAYADKAGIPASEQERFQFIAAKPV